MIEITKLSGDAIVLNGDLIESIEATPDTIIRLTNGKTIVVKETVKVIVERVIEFKRRIHSIGVYTADSEADSGSGKE